MGNIHIISKYFSGYVIAFLFFSFTGVAQTLPDDPIPERYKVMATTTAMMSQAAYHDPQFAFIEDELRKENWTWEPPIKLNSGLNYTVFHRVNDLGKKEFVVAFAGTETGKDNNIDLKTDAKQLYIPPAQYREVLNQIAPLIKQKDNDKNMSLTFTGHSLGGGLAQLVSMSTGLTSYVFNSAGLADLTVNYIKSPEIGRWLRDRGLDNLVANFFLNRKEKQELSSSTIINFHMTGDLVSSKHLDFITKQYGYKIIFKQPFGTEKKQFSDYGIHSMASMISATRNISINQFKNLSSEKVGGVLIDVQISYTNSISDSSYQLVKPQRPSQDSLIWDLNNQNK